jgi:hypothetical protein
MIDFRTLLTKHAGPGFLAGITVGDWLRLLSANGFRISPRHSVRAIGVTLNAPLTSLLKIAEDALFGGAIERKPLPPPLFILGSWRSGTTYLHTLLSADQRFGCPNLYETMFPHTFLLTEGWCRPLLQLLVPRKRFMDDMKMSLAEPHEDEMALAIMTQRSNMLAWVFPERADVYDRYLTFAEATNEDRVAWKQALGWYVRKIAYSSGKQVVLKSPSHTARIKLILETFPDARFLHIRRHPYDVYRSMCHMAGEVIPHWGLQAYSRDRIPQMVTEWYARLYNGFFDQRPLIPAGQYFELKFEELAADPLPQIASAYAALGLPDFSMAKGRVEAHVAAQREYKQNKHADLEPAVREMLARTWKRCFDAWDYPQD